MVRAVRADRAVLPEARQRPTADRGGGADAAHPFSATIFKIEDIEACEKAGINPYVPRPQRGPSVRARDGRAEPSRLQRSTDKLVLPRAVVSGENGVVEVPTAAAIPMQPFSRPRPVS